MSSIVRTEGLRKSFGGTTAVRDLDLEVEEGDILGFIGPNGAGKSTTLKMLATILQPSGGRAFIDGIDVVGNASQVRRLIGYMPDVCGLYEEMAVYEYLRFFCSVYKIRGQAAESIIDQVLELTSLTDKAGESCGSLSRGMSQRLHLARVLLHDPKLLLLDEPASGLDPRARIELRDLLLTLKGMGKTVIVSSHILSELGEMCDAIAIIEQSRLVYSGTVAEAMGRVREEGRVFRVRIRPDETKTRGDLVEVLKSLRGVNAVRDADDGQDLHVRMEAGSDDGALLNRELVQRGFLVEEFGEAPVRLEDAFLHLTQGLVQ